MNDATDETNAGTDAPRRERSKIAFPYGDLNDAVAVAKAIATNGGREGTLDQLAAWLKHENVESGTFKVKILTARTFGLVQAEDGSVSLTELGRQIVDPGKEAAARAQAFMQVPLYRAIYEAYKGHLLPGTEALETEMVKLGVAPKQKARARQGFQRSAEQANFFAHGKDRLVPPAGVSLDSTPPSGGVVRQMEAPAFEASTEINPLLASLIEELPVTGEWTREQHDFWMRVFQRTVDKLYKVKE